MKIIDLDNEVAEAMVNVFGDNIFIYRVSTSDKTVLVLLNDNVILKCYGFDRSVRVELGSKIFILEREQYWRIAIDD